MKGKNLKAIAYGVYLFSFVQRNEHLEIDEVLTKTLEPLII